MDIPYNIKLYISNLQLFVFAHLKNQRDGNLNEFDRSEK